MHGKKREDKNNKREKEKERDRDKIYPRVSMQLPFQGSAGEDVIIHWLLCMFCGRLRSGAIMASEFSLPRARRFFGAMLLRNRYSGLLRVLFLIVAQDFTQFNAARLALSPSDDAFDVCDLCSFIDACFRFRFIEPGF